MCLFKKKESYYEREELLMKAFPSHYAYLENLYQQSKDKQDIYAIIKDVILGYTDEQYDKAIRSVLRLMAKERKQRERHVCFIIEDLVSSCWSDVEYCDLLYRLIAYVKDELANTR